MPLANPGFQFFPVPALALRTDETGSRYWSVSLDRTMLTYFEVPPHTHFPLHHHESEQITHVLEGALSFEIGGIVVRVGAGETIAVRSNVPHAVFTDGVSAKAVDAWSPVPPQYDARNVDASPQTSTTGIPSSLPRSAAPHAKE